MPDSHQKYSRDPGDIRGFYNTLASGYDQMTSFDERFAKERPWFEIIVARFGINTALDAGCGTGFHAILLAQMGVEVAAVDLSDEMIKRALENSRRAGVKIRTVCAPLSGLAELTGIGGIGKSERAPGPLRSDHDAVFCLGNTLAHIPDDPSLDETLRNLRALLRPGGTLFIQLLNYKKILARRDETLSVRKVGDTTFERKYSYGPDRLTFTISISGAGKTGSGSVLLRPITLEILTGALHRCGLRVDGVFGGLALGPYNPETSPDLVVTASA